ncbi:hypothetical protein [Streptomyces sp. NPDC002788]
MTAPRPDARGRLWFPRRVRQPEPDLTFTTAHRAGSGSRGAGRAGRTLAVVGTDMGNVQLADRARGGLRIEEHTGLRAEFVGSSGRPLRGLTTAQTKALDTVGGEAAAAGPPGTTARWSSTPWNTCTPWAAPTADRDSGAPDPGGRGRLDGPYRSWDGKGCRAGPPS